MKTIYFHQEAEEEMVASAIFYEKQQPNLGKRFLTVIQDGINRIQMNPDLFPVVHLHVRRCIVHTFPFNILFQNAPDKVIVIAVMHQHRDPDYWKNR